LAEHLEKGVMIGIATDGFEIVVLAADAQAFLCARGAREGQTLLAEKDVFELNHPRVGESKVGSLSGTRDELRTTVWPCFAK